MPLTSLPERSAARATEVLREKQNVAAARSRRGRNLHGDDVDPVIEIFAESLLGDLRLQVSIGRRDDPGVERNLLVRTDRGAL